MLKKRNRMLMLALGALIWMGSTMWPQTQQGAFSQELVQQKGAGSGSMHLTVVTYNIHSGKDPDGNLNLDKTIATLKTTNADIIGLQEVEQSSPRTRFADQAKTIAQSLGMNYQFEPGFTIWPMQFGNVLLSKFPIEKTERISLPSTRENRVAILATLNVQGKEVKVMVTHLGLKQSEREAHVTTLVQRIAEMDEPFLLLGDFNTRMDGKELQPILKHLNQTAVAPVVTFPGEGQIDSIFASPDFSVNSIKTIDSQASDHLPLVVDLTL